MRRCVFAGALALAGLLVLAGAALDGSDGWQSAGAQPQSIWRYQKVVNGA